MDAIRVGIVGGGVVGSALHHVYDRPDLSVTSKLYDVLPERSKHSLPDVLDSDVIFLCLPTPAGKLTIMNDLDVSAIERFCEDHRAYRKLFVLKSTVPVGTTRRLAEKYELPNLVHCPEFLTERTAVRDAECPNGFVVGSRDSKTPLTLVELFDRTTTNTVVVSASYETSELAKLALNSFFAVKVSFFNELWHLTESVGIDYGFLIDAMLCVSDMLSESHTQVPGPDGMRGFGGACLPKDTLQLVKHLIDNKIEPVMTLGAITRAMYDRSRPSSQESPAGKEKL